MAASKFVATIKDFANNARAKLEGGSRAAIAHMAKSVIERSPVGTLETSKHPGAFRGNWQCGEALTFSADLTKRDLDGSETLTEIITALKAMNLSGDFRIYIANHVPYAVRLEYGWSDQAPSPPGIVRYAALQWSEKVHEVFVLAGGGEPGATTLEVVG